MGFFKKAFKFIAPVAGYAMGGVGGAALGYALSSSMDPGSKGGGGGGDSGQRAAYDSSLDDLKSYNQNLMSQMQSEREESRRRMDEYMRSSQDQISQLNMGFMNQIGAMKSAFSNEMDTAKQQNQATITKLNKSFEQQMSLREKQEAMRAQQANEGFQQQMGVRDKQNAMQAQQANLDLIKAKAKEKARASKGMSATMLTSPTGVDMGQLLLGKNSLLGL